MKIYILPVNQSTQPSRQNNIYPAHNDDYGVEQDFFEFLCRNPKLLTDRVEEADWHYLPIYWTRWLVNHDYGKLGNNELQQYVDKALISPRKTFTICQYDDGPVVNLHGTTVLLSSRKTKVGIDIPLLSSAHKIPLFKPRKKYLASFIGRVSTHKIRAKISNIISGNDKCLFIDGDIGTKKYVSLMLKSYVALCPRGYGGSSFRFYESMQLGLIPFLIGDIDTRPFKKYIEWDKFSFYTDHPKKIMEIINKYADKELQEMGKIAKEVWDKDLSYQKWCNFVLKELE